MPAPFSAKTIEERAGCIDKTGASRNLISEMNVETKQTFLPNGIHHTHINQPSGAAAIKRREWQRYRIPAYPDSFDERGIVTCAGGASYFTCAYVNIRLLRERGCRLPIELWSRKGELSPETEKELRKLNVDCKRFEDYTWRNIGGYQLKSLAIFYSRFKEILFLDADNTCLADPEVLFDSHAYREYGAVFWPDFWRTCPSNPMWEIVGSEAYHLPEQESGQILIDKERCWNALNLCVYFNLDPYYYQVLWGDKDTFRFAWLALKQPFYMISEPTASAGFSEEGFGYCGIAMLQHDVEGNPLFVHSNLMKWDSRKDGRLLWKEIRRKNGGPAVRTYMKEHPTRRKYFFTMEGAVAISPGAGAIEELEEEGLRILGRLRGQRWYKAFIKALQREGA